MIFVILSFLIGCGEKEDEGCKFVSWGETEMAVSNPVEMKSSESFNCSSYYDYFDGELNERVAQIKSFKLIALNKCTQFNKEIVDGEEWEEVDCPDFVPETVEFSELKGCSFETTPAANAACGFSALSLYFQCGTFFETAKWEFENVSSPQFDFSEDSNSEFASNKDGKTMGGTFIDESMTEMEIIFHWKETSEEVEEDKSVYRMYSVEVKP